MIELITANWDILLTCLVLVGVIAFLLMRGKKEIVYKILYALVNEAENLYGSGKGKLKFAYVMEKAYAALPAVIKVVITYKTFEKWIENAVAKMKEDLAEKLENSSSANEPTAGKASNKVTKNLVK